MTEMRSQAHARVTVGDACVHGILALALESQRPAQPWDVPILLVRSDGMIYPTRHTYRYSVAPYPMHSASAAASSGPAASTTF